MPKPVSKTLSFNAYKELAIMPVPVFIVDNQGIINFINSEAGKLFSPDDTVAENICDISSAFGKQDFKQALHQFKKNQSKPFESIIDIKHTFKHYYQLKLVAYQNDIDTYLVILYPLQQPALDTSVLKNNFKHLKQFSRFNAMREISSFIADQLNQPLTAILSYTQAMQRLYHEQASYEEISQAMERVVINASKAGELIRDIRTRSQLNTNTLNYTHTLLHPLINECIDFTDLGYFNSIIKLDKHYAPMITGVCVDTVQLKQVIISILNNAIDALVGNTRSPRITISTAIKDLYYEIAIDDNGPGIADTIKNRLFEPFVSTKKSGIGIGLSMCQHIIHLHKGKIKVISNNNSTIQETGTRVIITIPFIRRHSDLQA